ncbi:reverse transcriptase domain-containing protein [Tanacetum coccineum]
MAIVFAFDKFRSYLVLSKTTVHTDHSAPRHLFKKQDARPCLIRWIMLLQEFDIEIKDRKGNIAQIWKIIEYYVYQKLCSSSSQNPNESRKKRYVSLELIIICKTLSIGVTLPVEKFLETYNDHSDTEIVSLSLILALMCFLFVIMCFPDYGVLVNDAYEEARELCPMCSNTSKRVSSQAALKAAQQTKDGRDVEVSNLRAELENVKDKTLGAMEQLKESESEAKALRTMTQRMVLTHEDMLSSLGLMEKLICSKAEHDRVMLCLEAAMERRTSELCARILGIALASVVYVVRFMALCSIGVVYVVCSMALCLIGGIYVVRSMALCSIGGVFSYAFSDSLLLTPLCCDDINNVTPRVSALAGCDRLVSEHLVIENILAMFCPTYKKSRWGTVFPTGLKSYKEPLVEPKKI